MALVVGGNTGPVVEVYSPEGKCQHRLSDIPIGGTAFNTPVLAFIDENIFACAGIVNGGNGTVLNFQPEFNFVF